MNVLRAWCRKTGEKPPLKRRWHAEGVTEGFSSKIPSLASLDGPFFKGAFVQPTKENAAQNKTPLSLKETKANKPLRYHSSCRTGIPFRPLKCCPVTGASGGTYSGSAPCSKVIFSASSRPPCTKRRLSVRLGGGYSSCSAHYDPVCPISYPLFP